MAKAESEKLRVAREIVAGSRSLATPELIRLAHDLSEENQIGYARRVYAVALSMAPPELHDQIQIKVALTTYKDPDLPVDDRLKTAESLLLNLLSRPASLPVTQVQEASGILGGVYKQRWSVYGHKDHLERALFYYRSGYRLGIASDFAYTALNTAFVLDLLADAERGMTDEPSEASQFRMEEASRIRAEIVSTLPALVRTDNSLESQWWFDCTLGEAYLGLRRFDEARSYVQKVAGQHPDNWRLESTARQMAHIVRLQSKAVGLPLERWNEAPGFCGPGGPLGW